jgi:hypothetical protein
MLRAASRVVLGLFVVLVVAGCLANTARGSTLAVGQRISDLNP